MTTVEFLYSLDIHVGVPTDVYGAHIPDLTQGRQQDPHSQPRAQFMRCSAVPWAPANCTDALRF